ncbi:hypothetical protein BGC39_01220 [Levilactobacillus brevis]|nr:hypothetical protein BGC39_01220 [Levilactobacillus brevis]
MRTDTIFSIIYFALFTVFYFIGISKFFVIVYLILELWVSYTLITMKKRNEENRGMSATKG